MISQVRVYTCFQKFIRLITQGTG